MARILIVIPPYPSIVYSTLGLAARLKKRGHGVSYAGLADSEDAVRQQGYAFMALFESHFPLGFLKETEILETQRFGWRLLQAKRDFVRRLENFAAELANGAGEEFRQSLQSLAPDLVIFASADIWVEWPAFVAVSMGLRCIYFHDYLAPETESSLPAKLLHPLQRLWQKIEAFMLKPLGLYLDFAGVRRRLAGRYGCELPSVDDGCQVPRLPVLVAWPQALDDPGAARPGRYLAGAMLNLERIEPDFPWERLREGRKLAYCSLGTLVWLSRRRYAAFFKTVMACACSWPDWDWVIEIRGGVMLADLGPVPENVVIVERTPQLGILKRAHLVLTHGGAATIKEAVYFGVPLIVFPLGVDQPENAARIARHGIGLRASLKKLTPGRLNAMIGVLEGDPAIRRRMEALQQQVRDEEAANRALALIEALLQDEPVETAFGR
ncbi:MAG TPA: glycosyltransferase [Methylocella sp.]|nr:glycosyltransferase [Methylocella sp.]